MKKAIFSVFCVIFVLFTFPVHADEKPETCRSYIVDLSVNKKYCLFDADERIAEFNQKIQIEKDVHENECPKEMSDITPSTLCQPEH